MKNNLTVGKENQTFICVSQEFFVFLAFVGLTLAAQQCCPDGDMLTAKGRCQTNDQRVSMNCTSGKWLLKEAYTVGDKLYSLDAPNFVYVEDPTQ